MDFLNENTKKWHRFIKIQSKFSEIFIHHLRHVRLEMGKILKLMKIEN